MVLYFKQKKAGEICKVSPKQNDKKINNIKLYMKIYLKIYLFQFHLIGKLIYLTNNNIITSNVCLIREFIFFNNCYSINKCNFQIYNTKLILYKRFSNI